MADTRLLLTLLEDYQQSLRRQAIVVRSEFSQLEQRWLAFSTVYEGDSADQFRSYWLQTAQRFRDYLDNSDNILRILDERIEALRIVNTPQSGL